MKFDHQVLGLLGYVFVSLYIAVKINDGIYALWKVSMAIIVSFSCCKKTFKDKVFSLLPCTILINCAHEQFGDVVLEKKEHAKFSYSMKMESSHKSLNPSLSQ